LKLVECVPNFSEGRRKEVLEAIVKEARVRSVNVLDMESDADHNRSVLTFVGTPDAVKDAALAVSAKAIELIDLNHHQGQHPRMGAVDVVPFIPISEVSMEECIQIAKDFGKAYAERFHVPVYLYEEAATRQDRRNLADVRKGEFEGLRDLIGKDPNRVPDFGPNTIHPTAGCTAVGARQILIAYNINLATSNLDIAKQIAKQVRGKDGGFSAVKALGFALKDRGIVQVSMNMVNYKASQLFKVFELVGTFAERYGVEVLGSEVVGLVPMEALTDSAEFYLRLQGFNKNQILERKLFEKTDERLVAMNLETFASEVASDKPVPGGGSVSAYSGALAAGLLSMVCRLTLKKAECEKGWGKAGEILSEAELIQKRLTGLVDEDANSFSSLMQAYRLPKQSEEEKRVRSGEIQARVKVAADVPMSTAEQTARVIALCKELADVANENALSDLQTAVFVAYAGTQGALANVAINLGSIKDADYVKQATLKMDRVRSAIEQQKGEALGRLSVRGK
jgi:glutamate formiminotransferase/formiminotetrahydrofolate cyclodeaminase